MKYVKIAASPKSHAASYYFQTAVVCVCVCVCGGGGGSSGPSHPEIMGAGAVSKKFFRTLGPQFGLKIREERQPPSPRAPPLDLLL